MMTKWLHICASICSAIAQFNRSEDNSVCFRHNVNEKWSLLIEEPDIYVADKWVDLMFIEEDIVTPENYLAISQYQIIEFSFHHDKILLTNKLGRVNNRGYINGAGENATIGFSPSFLQLDNGTILLADFSGNCIRMITRGVVFSIDENAGQCGKKGTLDGIGTEALFHYPSGFTQNKFNSNQIFISQTSSSHGHNFGAIRVLDLSDRRVSTLFISNRKYLAPIIMVWYGNDLFAAGISDVFLHFSGFDDSQDVDCCEYEEVKFKFNHPIPSSHRNVFSNVIILRESIALAVEIYHGKLYLIDLEDSDFLVLVEGCQDVNFFNMYFNSDQELITLTKSTKILKQKIRIVDVPPSTNNSEKETTTTPATVTYILSSTTPTTTTSKSTLPTSQLLPSVKSPTYSSEDAVRRGRKKIFHIMVTSIISALLCLGVMKLLLWQLNFSKWRQEKDMQFTVARSIYLANLVKKANEVQRVMDIRSRMRESVGRHLARNNHGKTTTSTKHRNPSFTAIGGKDTSESTKRSNL